MTKKKSDRTLGMDAEISRRDFLDGMAVAIGGAMIPGLANGSPGAAQTAAYGL